MTEIERSGQGVVVRVGGRERIVAPGDSYRASSGRGVVDVVIAFDTTGSMTDKIDGLVACTAAMVDGLAASAADWAVTAVPFGDLRVPGDTIELGLPWHREVTPATTMLRSLRRNGGGGNVGESSLEALEAAMSKRGRQGAVKVVLLITDEPAHGTERAPQVEASLCAHDVLCSVVSPRLGYFQRFAEATGGVWLPIAATVDLHRVIATFCDLGVQVAQRTTRVLQAGGSPQGLLALERGW